MPKKVLPKFFLKSKGIVGGILAIAVFLLEGARMLGLELPVAPDEATGIIQAVLALGAGILTIVGRIRATQPISLAR